MADAGVTPQWFVLLSNHVKSWVDERTGTGDPFTSVEQEADHTIRIYGPTYMWRLAIQHRNFASLYRVDPAQGAGGLVVTLPSADAEANVIAVLQEYADRWHAEALAEALA